MPILLSNLLDEKILINNFLMNQFSRKNRQDKKITVSDWMNKIFTNIKKRSSIDFQKKGKNFGEKIGSIKIHQWSNQTLDQPE